MPAPKEQPRDRNVFINCPYDDDYKPFLEVIIFTVIACGFRPRLAAVEFNSGKVRLEKIKGMIDECRYGIHDISRVEISKKSRLPRFNMPYELGLDMGSKQYGTGWRKTKTFLILDAKPYQYQASLSDVAGCDPAIYNADPEVLLKKIRSWLYAESSLGMPGPIVLLRHFKAFSDKLPTLCDQLRSNPQELNWFEYIEMASTTLAATAS